MKRFLQLITTATLAILAGCTSPVFDDGLLDNLSGNNKIYYTSTDGEKIMPYSIDGVDAVLLSNTYKNGRGCMTFDEEVTKLNGLFNFANRLVSVELPNSLTEIGWRSFGDCVNLVEITIPKSVTSIGKYAFDGCSSLASITIPEGVTSIGEDAFYDCSSLTSITIPEGVTSIGEDAFYDCSSLTSVYCKPTTPPSGGSGVFSYLDYSSSAVKPIGCTIYVPRASVDAYKSAKYWRNYADDIVGYDFE